MTICYSATACSRCFTACPPLTRPSTALRYCSNYRPPAPLPCITPHYDPAAFLSCKLGSNAHFGNTIFLPWGNTPEGGLTHITASADVFFFFTQAHSSRLIVDVEVFVERNEDASLEQLELDDELLVSVDYQRKKRDGLTAARSLYLHIGVCVLAACVSCSSS